MEMLILTSRGESSLFWHYDDSIAHHPEGIKKGILVSHPPGLERREIFQQKLLAKMHKYADVLSDFFLFSY